MVSIQTKTGLDAVRAYDPYQMYSGKGGAISLLGHCILEIVYKRAYEPRQLADVRRRYARVRLPNGRFATTPVNTKVWRTEWRDRTQRSMFDGRDPPKEWFGAPRRRMLVTLDFRMLRDWGQAYFGFPASTPNVSMGAIKDPRQKDDIIVVWDCLWRDWRRLKLSEPATVVTVIPTSVFPNCQQGVKAYRTKYEWMLNLQKRIASAILDANFFGSASMMNKANLSGPLYAYLNNRTTGLNLQFQEEELRLKAFGQRQKAEEERKRREEARKAEEQRKAAEAEAAKKAQEQKAAEEAQRQKEEAQRAEAEKKAALAKAQQQQRQQPQQVQQQQQKQSLAAQNKIVQQNRPGSTNLEKPGNVEVEEGVGKKVEMEYSNVTNTMVEKKPTFDGTDQNSIPVDGIVDENGVRKDKRNA